jgi:hypothetical protein
MYIYAYALVGRNSHYESPVNGHESFKIVSAIFCMKFGVLAEDSRLLVRHSALTGKG